MDTPQILKYPMLGMRPSRLAFEIQATASGSGARAARFRTLHNEVLTPLFMPVGTQATVKAQTPETLLASGSQILLANTYHLLLRPGREVFDQFGGIHNFMKWPRSVLTDSGGYQIFSLPHSRNISEDGAVFQSYVDGTRILLSPETSIGMQRAIGSDIMMVLDQCIPSTADRRLAEKALGITHRWAKRSLEARGDSSQSLFGIVQGALYPDLRKLSADQITNLDLDGYAIGGLAVGEEAQEREDTCELTAALLPHDRPRYLMGVGTPLDVLEAVHRGVDMFDCIIPTQFAQRGAAFTSRGIVQLRRSVYKLADAPLDPACTCPTCTTYSRAYLHHLAKTEETFGWHLLGQHNIYFYHLLMREIRASILNGRFLELYNERRQVLGEGDVDHPVKTRKIKAPKGNPRLGEYEIHTATEGFSSIRHVRSGEIMHSRTPPMVEAERLYVRQSGLEERLQETTDTPLVIWDVGLGAAANAMAAIQCYERGAKRPMEIVSFENDLDSLRLALRYRERFTYLRHSGPDTIAKVGEWRSKQFPSLSWRLCLGDFAQESEKPLPLPDLIFYDMFSRKTDAPSWKLSAFEQLYRRIAGRPAELYTYTVSTATRASLLGAGFYVASGISTGDKSETTVAFTPEGWERRQAAQHAQGMQLLNAKWLEHWERSGAKHPPELHSEQHAAFENRIRSHVQFSPLPNQS